MYALYVAQGPSHLFLHDFVFNFTFLRQGFSTYSRLAFASQVLGLNICTTTTGPHDCLNFRFLGFAYMYAVCTYRW